MTDGAGVTTAPAMPDREVGEFAASVVATRGAVVSPLQPKQASRRSAEAERATLMESFFTTRLSTQLQEAEEWTLPAPFPLVRFRLSQCQYDGVTEG